MTLRLDPRLPLVWRSPFGMQVGIDPVVVRIDDVTDAQQRMLAALAVGTSSPGLAVMAGGRTPDAAAARDDLLKLLAPALERPPGADPGTVAISGSATLVGAIAALLAGHGVTVLIADDAADLAERRPDLAVVVGHFVLAPKLHALWLRRDVPHLGVVVGDTATVVGPMIEPGTGPCLLCLELHHRDADRAWPAIASQLLGRVSGVETAILVAETAAAAARLVIDRLRGATAGGTAESLRIDAATGERRRIEWQVHPECGCRGIRPLEDPEDDLPVRPARPGTGWASAARIAPAAYSTPS
ncbi:bacteriocin biosynthesis cyclodehydratase domain-containing protein [Salinibacterium sp. CAN_S4]|uniref:TOMM precursor leader peptide-binding protein n=1 Tax=Salinibacterium sp. CAN_S4 TaxID=2787727 RepID=UPI0018F01DD1